MRQVADLQHRHPVDPGRAATEMGSHPREELGEVERLGDIVVGAQVQATHPILDGSAGGQHDHGDVAVGADPTQEVEAVPIGQAHVDDHEVGSIRSSALEPCLRRSRADHVDAVLAEAHLDEIEDPRLVIHDEHGRPPKSGGARVCRGDRLRHAAIPRHPVVERNTARFPNAPIYPVSQRRLSRAMGRARYRHRNVSLSQRHGNRP